MKKLLEEPILHFLVIGAALFLVFGWRGSPSPAAAGRAGAPESRIVVTRDDVARMNELFAKTWQRSPTEAESRGLVEDFVRSEIYYREALAMGLDRNDEVLKRRLRQKMEFIYEDLASLGEPTDADLAAFAARHREKYLADPEVAFRQVYVSTYKRGANAEPDARRLLAQLDSGTDPDTVGDSTLLEPEVRLSPRWDVAKQFGEEFAQSVLAVKRGRWSGPVRSSFGLHLVLVTDRREGRLPALGEIRDAVKRDWMVERQKELKDAAYAKLRERYAVTVEAPKAAGAPLAAAAATSGEGASR